MEAFVKELEALLMKYPEITGVSVKYLEERLVTRPNVSYETQAKPVGVVATNDQTYQPQGMEDPILILERGVALKLKNLPKPETI